MKVFGIGLARTGSASLTQALGALGVSSKHFPTNYLEVDTFDGLTDTSVTVGYKYLDFMFPASRFILTVRDIDSWLGSMQALLQHLNGLGIADRYHRLHYSLYRTTSYDEQRLRLAYTRHLEDVRDHFKDRADQLLEFDVSVDDPFDRLCQFLACSHPGTAFPHLNDRSAMLSTRRNSMST